MFLYGVLSLAHGQQTIFNVPTTDVLDKGKVYAELDASFEKPINKKVTFAADWFTGKHRRAISPQV